MKAIISKNEHGKICEIYEQGLSTIAIGKKYGVSIGVINRILKNNNIELRNRNEKISTNEYKKIVDLYNSGLSTYDIANIYNVKHCAILTILNKENCKMRTPKDFIKIYNCNENYFEKIDTPDKAYWLGFIYADGYIREVSDDSKILTITISDKDRNLLEKFNYCLNSDYKIYNRKNVDKNYCSITISSTKLVNDLINHGVFQRKTFILKPPKINTFLIKDFIRGYLDGDGCLYINKNNIRFQLTGTSELLNYIDEYFYSLGLIKNKHILTTESNCSKIYRLSISGNVQTEKIINHLYKEATIFLERKYNKYLEWKAKNE